MKSPCFQFCKVGSIASSAGRVYRADSRNTYFLQVGYISRESAMIETESDRTEVEAGELFFIPQCDAASHTIYYSEQRPTWQFWFEFFNDNPSSTDLAAVNALPKKMKADARILQLIESVYTETSLHNTPENIAPDFLNLIGRELLNRIFQWLENPASTGGRSEELIEKAIQFIHRHYRLPLDSTTIAAHCGISRDHLIHTFRKNGYATPIQVLWDIRLRQAALMLESTSLTLDDIAERTGFKNVYHFSRRFKQQYACPPGQYRKNHAPDGRAGA